MTGVVFRFCQDPKIFKTHLEYILESITQIYMNEFLIYLGDMLFVYYVGDQSLQIQCALGAEGLADREDRRWQVEGVGLWREGRESGEGRRRSGRLNVSWESEMKIVGSNDIFFAWNKRSC